MRRSRRRKQGFTTGNRTKAPELAGKFASIRSRPRPSRPSTNQQNGSRQNISKIAFPLIEFLGSSTLSQSRTRLVRRPIRNPEAMKKKRRPNSTDVQVGESIRAHRLIAGMSQSDLASRIGVSFQQVQKYEKGANRVGAGRLPQIAAIFNIPISALFEAHAHALPGKGNGGRRAGAAHREARARSNCSAPTPTSTTAPSAAA